MTSTGSAKIGKAAIRELAVEIRISSSVREFWHVARRSLRRSFNGASCHVAEKASRYRNSRLSPTVFSGYTVSPSRADCTWAVHSDHASRLLGSQGGDWRGRNTYFYDTMWYIWGVPPPFTAAQVITSSRSLVVSQYRCCCAVPCAPLTHFLYPSSPLRPDTAMTTTHVVVAAMPTPSPTAGKVASPFPHYM